MLIQSFNNNKIQSADIIYATNQDAAYPATNFLTKYTRDKAKFTTSTTIRLDNVSSARDICIFGLTATSGAIRIEAETSNVVTLTSNTTYTTNTDILGTLTSNDGITVTSNDGVTIRGVGAGLIEQSLTFADGNLRRENFYFDYGSTATTLSISLSLVGASQIGLFWAGVLSDYGYSEKWGGDNYDFLTTKANYKAMELLDKRLFYIVHPNRNQNGDMLLYGSVTIAKINYSEDLWLGGVAYGETNIEVKENG